MTTLLTRLISMLALSALAACGGGGGGTSPFGGDAGSGGGGGSTPAAADIVLSVSAASVPNTGTETVVATATAIDANRNTVAGVPVTISVDSGGVITPSGTVTDASGLVTATVGIGSDHSTRTLTVSATSGGITKTAQLQVVSAVGGGSGTAPSDLLLILDSATIANDGSSTVAANVTALDARRNVMSGVAVALSVDQGGTVLPNGSTTGTNGVLSGAIGIGANRTNRTITVTATAGTLVRTAALQVVDAATPVTPAAADLSLSLSGTQLDNGGANTIVATATAVDSRRNALAGIPVTFTVDSSAVATVSGSATNAQGVVTANVGIGADRSSRVVTVTATSGVITRSASFTVTGASLSASFAPLVEAGSTNNGIEFKLVDGVGSAMAGQVVSVTAPGLGTGSGVTDVNGKYVYSYTAPASTTTLAILGTAAGVSANVTVAVQAGGTLDPAASLPQSASLTPSPSVISVNTAQDPNTNQVELRALFLGANNQPISNIRARFDLAGNANNTDGVISWLGGNYAYSDSTGVARGTFTPGLRSSPTNGVTVRVCYDTVDFPITACPSNKQATNTLTVTSEALSVSIRTNELIQEGAAQLTYIKQFVVMVVDAAGRAKAGVTITPSVDLPSYYKGVFVWNGLAWAQQRSLANSENYAWDAVNLAWVRQSAATPPQPSCPNEDVNRNGVREAPVYDPTVAAPALAQRQEDLNWNGDLDPRKADVAITMVGSPTTDSSGLAILQIEYGKNLAGWVDFVITATASGISGTEARAHYSGLLYGVGNLPYPAEAVTNQNAPPAFVISPYGRDSVCTDPN